MKRDYIPGMRRKTGKKPCRSVCMAACFLVAAIVLLLSAKTVHGDVIWTPDDAFYEENYKDCDYLGRHFYANGKDGYVAVRERPARGKVLDFVGNGSVLYVSMVYDAGMSGKWGVVQYQKDDDGVPVEDYSYGEGALVGWIDLDQLVVVYDNQSFTEEHAAEIKEVKPGESLEISVPENGSLCYWEYPGAAGAAGEFSVMEDPPEFNSTYEDQNGDLWAHSNYYYGYKDFWINLNRPGEKESRLEQKEAPQLIPAMDREKLERLPKNVKSGPDTPVAVGGLILLVIVLTVIVIRLMAGKRDGGERADKS